MSLTPLESTPTSTVLGMADRLVIHIGPRNTGSTYLQAAFTALAPDLTGRGILYPMLRRGPVVNHVPAVVGLVHDSDHRIPDDRWSGVDRSTWDDLMGRIRQWPGDVMLSAEVLGHWPSALIDLLHAEVAHIETRIVATTRPLVHVIPSSWKQQVSSTRHEGFDEFLARIRAERSLAATGASSFWLAYSYGHLVDRWQQAFGASAVHVVAIGERRYPDPTIWTDIVRASGLWMDFSAPAASIDDANVAVSDAQALALWRVNVEYQDLPREEIRRRHRHLATSRAWHELAEGALTLPDGFIEDIAQWSAADDAVLAATGALVHATS